MTLYSVPPPAENRQETPDHRGIAHPISEQRLICPGDTLTTRQVQCLRGIEYAIRHFGAAPRRRELLSMLGITSQRYLRKDVLGALEAKGFIRVVPRVAGGIVVLIPSSEADIDDSKSPAKAAGPGLVKAKPRAGAERKAVGT